MANAGWSDDIKESTVKAENNVDIEETCVNLNCVKNESNEEGFDLEDDSPATQYKISFKYENLFGEFTHYRIINEDYDNLIGFEGADVIMENAMIKLEAIKEEDDLSLNNFYCSKCKGVYKGYCLKCSTLLCILNNLSSENSASEFNMPTNILEIRETSRGKGVYLLRTLPKSIIFGPFEGVLGIESTLGHSWKIIDNKLSHVEYGNWMKNIVCAPNASLKNLDILQLDGNLYFQTNREITEDEQLLIYYDDEKLCQMDNGEEYLYTPQKMEKLPKVFACTTCCFGFGSSKCLMEHKKKCCPLEYTKSIKDFILVECYYCKMWMEKWEHEEHHVAHCFQKHQRMTRDYSEGDMDVEEMEDDRGTNDEKTQCFFGASHDIGFTERPNNEEVHNATETHNEEHFKKHLNKQGGIKKFQCDICMVSFTQRGYLKVHMRNKHTGDGSTKHYKCPECSYETNYKNLLQDHLNKHKGIKPFQCDNCMKKFSSRNGLKMHVRNKHTGDGIAKDYKCSECPYQTNYKISLQSHLNKHRGIKPFECGICRMKFGQKEQLKMHMKNKHAAKGSEKDYKCSECPYQTNHKICLQAHLNKHRGIKPFECNNCKMKFGQKQGVYSHMKYKHAAKDTKSLQCHICMMKFFWKSRLTAHIKNKHSESEKDYRCSECPYQTNRKSDLQKHLNNTHRGIKPFECDICKAKFKKKDKLRVHIKNEHAANGSAKDHKCPECTYETNDISYFRRHVDRHKGIKPYQCDICMKRYTEKDSLKTHIKISHAPNGSEKDYKCSECSYQTYRKGDLNKHLNIHRRM